MLRHIVGWVRVERRNMECHHAPHEHKTSASAAVIAYETLE